MDTTFDHISRNKLPQLPPGDVFDANCPSRTVVEMLANKWTVLVVQSLASGPRRFGEIRRQVEGVTQKMLTQSLRSLERDGLATRTVYATTPPSVEYALTPLGKGLIRITDRMCRWAEANMVEVVLARRSYDKGADVPANTTKVLARRNQTA
ncbi:winged helix-turn-helix transcriptional regulator [Roseateles noduli]|jgi:DNA-binding HxlR family transcriptional regulator|uniref:winged helix-turn-helix transcriptional regulator n=1 Tax=Roseateles noduli TaxID=2052484 RepID=UPI003D65163E